MPSVKSAALLALAALVPGCANSENNKWLGAGIGAGAGLLAGRALAPKGKGTAGAIIGAVVGGVAGYAVAGGFGGKASEARKAEPEFQEASGEFDAGQAAKKQGDDAAALDHYKKATSLAPEQPEPYNNAGMIYLGQGDRAKAEEMFRKALAADPDFEPAKVNLRKMGVAA